LNVCIVIISKYSVTVSVIFASIIFCASTYTFDLQTCFL
jgi:hypothetical protein